MNPVLPTQTLWRAPAAAGAHRVACTRQRGIGVLGFIFGLVIGLAIALAVAVYITKVPTPFTDKSGVRTAEEQAAEEAKLKNWNPNDSLASKVPLNAASGAAIPASETASIAWATQPSASSATPAATPAQTEAMLRAREQAQAKAKAKAEEDRKQTEAANASSDPIDSLLQARSKPATSTTPTAPTPTPAPAAAKPDNATEAFVYFVQAGAFRDPADADAQKARLSLQGMSARVSTRDQAGRTVHRVRLGPFNTKAEADRARARLESNGMEAALVRVER